MGILNDEEAEEVVNAVRGVVYNAYSLILMELTEQDESLADTWLRLTARGMNMSVSGLAQQLWAYNTDKLARQAKRKDTGHD